MKDYYKTLDVSPNASVEEIKKAYRKLAHKHHPDRGGDEKKFKEINEAYQVLGDKEKRSQYDRFGKAFEGQGPGYGPFGYGPSKGGFDFGRQGFDFGDIDLGDIFSDFFGGGTRTKVRKRKGQDTSIDLEITLEEAFKGKEQELKLKKKVICPRCQGNGAEPGSHLKSCPTCGGRGRIQQVYRTFLGSITRTGLCPECQGEGKIPEIECNLCKGQGRVIDVESILIKIPAGINDKEIIKIENKGEAGPRGSQMGDLYVKIHLKKHPKFKREGNDVYYELPLSFSQAALGDIIEIPILEGKVKLKIPAGIESSQELRLKGKGIPHLYQRGVGDQIVIIKIITPKSLSRKQKELLKKLKDENL